MSTIIFLFGIGIFLLLVEIVIPGGILGIIGIVCIITGVVLGFIESATLGLALFAGVLVFGTLSFFAWIKYFPKTSVGKQMFLDKDAKDWQGYEIENKNLIGASGITQTPLRPSGLAVINKKRIDVVTRGELIDRGEPVKVIEVEGNRIVVTVDKNQD